MADRNFILRKLTELEAYLRQIREFSSLSTDEYLSDWKVQRIVERTLQIMLETCIDIANHMISDGNMRVPVNYDDTFRVLFQQGLIDEDLLATMERMAKFRNIVVHQYEVVDAEIVILILRKHLADFERFKTAVLNYEGKRKDS